MLEGKLLIFFGRSRGRERERPAELNLNVKDQDKFRSEIFYELIQNSKENEEAGAKYIFVTRYFC